MGQDGEVTALTPPPAPSRPERYYDVFAVSFVGLLLIANVAATKLFAVPLGPIELIFDGGAVLFPLTYVLGDVLAELYGFKSTRRVVLLGFALSALAALTFWLVGALPPAPGYENQAAFQAVLGFVPRIVAASLVAFVVGQLLNAYVLVFIKKRFGAGRLWVRLIGSSAVGQGADTLIFCTIAFFGVITGGEFWNYVLVGYAYKLGLEVVLLPLTYRVIGWAQAGRSA